MTIQEATSQLTSSERLTNALNRQETDRAPEISHRAESDLIIVGVNDQVATDSRNSVVAILNPFGRVLADGRVSELLELCHSHPEAGAEILAGYVESVRSQMKAVQAEGHFGVLYVLVGAEPHLTSPMEYGGLFLEWDRELLSEANGNQFVALYVQGGTETYFDFVSDLEADLFIWNKDLSQVSVDAMKQMRFGALACDDPTADVLWLLDDDFLPTNPVELTKHAV